MPQSRSSHTVVTKARAHDHIYDPCYQTSSYHSHLRAHQKATMGQIEQVSNFPNIFSDVASYPRAHYRMKQSATQMSPFPKQGQSLRVSAPQDVIGKDRAKFFKRPVAPYMDMVPADLMLTNREGEEETKRDGPVARREVVQATRTVGIQSMYRESEAQTTPYSPDYKLSENDPEPEVLTISHFQYGEQLPASLEDVNTIHRLREKRAMEAALPEPTDEHSLRKRRQMLEEQEMKEWALREEEMLREQELRLGLIVDAIRERESKNEEYLERRVARMKQKKEKEHEKTLQNIHRQRVKILRKLARTTRFCDKDKDAPDVVNDYSNFGSKKYAPVIREGRVPVQNPVVEFGIPATKTFHGISELEASLPSNVTEITVKRPAKILPSIQKTRAGQKAAADLELVDTILKKHQDQTNQAIEVNIYKQFDPLIRPSTPSVEPDVEEVENAVTFLQRLVRGRAIQNAMYEGKETCLELINELRIVPSEEDLLEEEPVADVSDAVELTQGHVMGGVLDFISKEVVRQQELKKVRAISNDAEETRRIREAEEKGRRQAEELLRNKQEEQYAEVMAVNRESADAYVAEVTQLAIESLASKRSVVEATVKNELISAVKKQIDGDQSVIREAVTNLVTGFLLPEVDRRRRLREAQVEENKYIHAAHETVLDAVKGAVDQASSVPSSEE